MTAKTPDPQRESPATAASPTPSAAVQPKPAAAGAPPKPPVPPPVSRPPAAPTPRRRGFGAATAIALLSLLVAAGAAAIAIYALDVAREAKSAAAPRIGAEVVPTPATSTPAAPGTPIVSPTPPPSPRPVFLPDIISARVPIAQPDNCASNYVDIDTLQVGTYSGHEFYLITCDGPQTIRVDRKDSAVPTSAQPSPDECAAQLAGIAGGPELRLEVRVGLTFCLLTSSDDATAQNIPQRLAIVEVKTISPDRSLTIEVSTFRIQQAQS